MEQNNKRGLLICGLPVWLFIIPPFMLIFAPLFEWPTGYFQILRLTLFILAGMIAFSEYKANHKNIAVAAGLIAILFNPLLKIHFSQEVWVVIDYVVAGVWVYFLWRNGLKFKWISLIFGIPIGCIILLIGVAFLAEIPKNHAEKIRNERLREERQLKYQEEMESKARLEEEKKLGEATQQAAREAAERELIENANNIEVVEFGIKPGGSIVKDRIAFYSWRLVLNNKNDYPVAITEAMVFFMSSDGNSLKGDLHGNPRLATNTSLSIELGSILQTVLEPNSPTKISGTLFNWPRDADLGKTMIKITKAQRESSVVEYSPEEIKAMEEATPVSGEL